jgi:signal transduction histidine kinase
VERIVENLVYNAIKYSRSESPIVVLVQPYEDGVLLAVEDEGPGVPDSLKEEVFQPFRQGPNRSPHSPGTGIGLSLVARFAELHGGKAWVEDRPGGGSSFRVYLPDGPEDVSPEPDEADTAAAPTTVAPNGRVKGSAADQTPALN